MPEPLDIKSLFSQPGAPSYPFCDDRGQLCWLEALTEEGGRLAIKQQISDGERVVTPADFQVRSRVNEYGGQCFCVAGEYVYFNNFSDGLIYRQHLHRDEEPVAVSLAQTKSIAYADLHYCEALDVLVAIQEMAGPSAAENINRVVAFSLAQTLPAEPQLLREGADFYAAPCVSDQGDQLAWLEWSNPYMPWDETRLYCSALSQNGNKLSLVSPRHIAGGEKCSVCQPGFLSDGDLVFAMDSDAPINQPQNYWNLYRSHNATITALTAQRAEFGEAHWVFGQRRWVQYDAHHLLVIRSRDELDTLCELNLQSDELNLQSGEVNLQSGELLERCEPASRFSQLSLHNQTLLGIVHSPDQPPAIFRYRSGQDCLKRKTAPEWMAVEYISEPELLCFATRDGDYAYANYYAAKPLHAQTPISLLVLVHGGPTSRADTALSPLVQYFCQNGFAVLDVNHRGSTGHGRVYRQKLLGQWGEIDANDIADAIEFAFSNKQHDPQRVFIRGGSAGGYAVLRALTRFPELFCGGACYYGIGNLITLAEITHKFEAKYTDRLIGEDYDRERAQQADSRFRSRSPIFDIDRIRSPLILFQGLEDKVVPPQVSREMVETLERNGVPHEYVEYPGEGHGFRQAQTRIDALQREIQFYQRILRLVG